MLNNMIISTKRCFKHYNHCYKHLNCFKRFCRHNRYSKSIKSINFIKNRMIKRLIEYLTIERRTEYIQYKSSSKSNNARNYINYSTLKTISIKISTLSFAFMFQ